MFKLPLDQSFTYCCDIQGYGENDLLYRRVLCPFLNKKKVGLVIACSNAFSDDFVPKNVVEIIDSENIIDDRVLKIANWIKNYYFSSLGEALSLFFSFNKKVHKVMKTKDKNNELEQIVLNEEQNKVFEDVIYSEKELFLLQGITGSGKTHVYIKIIDYFKKRNKQSILLLPEIVLTPQIEKLFSRYFNPKEIAILHSRVSNQKKINYFRMFYEGEINIIIGTRSAVFAIPKDLGIIIIDEEHEDTFKNNSTPRYHVRQVAQKMNQVYHTKVLFGSATPSIELYYQAIQSKIVLLKLNHRFYDSLLPDFSLISDSFDDDQIISDELIAHIQKTINDSKTAMIFINRRGHSSHVCCMDCRHLFFCTNCNITYTYHKNKNIFLCHYCNNKKRIEQYECNQCYSKRFELLGVGIEKVISFIDDKLDGAKILRMDRDVLTTENKIKEALSLFENGDMNILVGTQILSKGHDFPTLKMVAILYPENELSLSDFRASQRTYNQITQVSGRAGRREERGHVYIQTKMFDHYSIELGAKQTYDFFFEKEIAVRELFNYPPFSKLIRLVVRSKIENDVIKCTRLIKQYFDHNDDNFYEILGPSVCIFSKINNNHRWNILFKIKRDYSIFFDKMMNFKKNFNHNKHSVYIEYDVDPNEIL